MKLGIGSYTYTWAVGVKGWEPARRLSARDLIARARDLDVEVVQYADNLPLDCMSDGELRALRADAGDLALEVGTRGIAPEHLRRYLRVAAVLGSSLLRVVVDTADSRPGQSEIVRTLGELVPDLEQAGVTLAVENHDRFGASVLAGMIRSVGHPRVGVCLDTVNSLGALDGLREVVELLAPLVVNLHVKDFDIRRTWHSMGFVVEGRPAGQGRLDVPRLIANLTRAGRNPSVILELWTPPEADIASTVRKEAQWAQESIRFLKTVMPR